MTKNDYKKIALNFACKHCSPVTAGETKNASNDFTLMSLLMDVYSYGSYTWDDFNAGEKSYLTKVAKGVKLGGLDDALWII